MQTRFNDLLIDDESDDQTDQIEIISVEWGARKIPTSHGRHVTGRFPMGPGDDSIPYESRLERDFIALGVSCPGFRAISAQPVTVTARVGTIIVEYTPDFLLSLARVPKCLQLLGFENRTFVEVKPAKFVNHQKLRMKFLVLRKALNLPCILMRESEIRGGTNNG